MSVALWSTSNWLCFMVSYVSNKVEYTYIKGKDTRPFGERKYKSFGLQYFQDSHGQLELIKPMKFKFEVVDISIHVYRR